MRISFDSVAKFYDKLEVRLGILIEQLVKTLSSELSSYRARATISKAGVGTRRFANLLQDNGFEVFGIESARKMIEIIKLCSSDQH